MKLEDKKRENLQVLLTMALAALLPPAQCIGGPNSIRINNANESKQLRHFYSVLTDLVPDLTRVENELMKKIQEEDEIIAKIGDDDYFTNQELINKALGGSKDEDLW